MENRNDFNARGATGRTRAERRGRDARFGRTKPFARFTRSGPSPIRTH